MFSVDSDVGKHIEAKTAAEALADKWRDEIREGTFRRQADAAVVQPVPTERLTHARFGGDALRAPQQTRDEERHRVLWPTEGVRDRRARFGGKAVSAITEDDVELFFARLRAEGLAASTRNRYIQLVKALFRWATKKSYLARNQIADTETLKREKNAQRNRRPEPAEEAALLEQAGTHLQRLIIGAMETGCRRGELLALTWRDVNVERRELTVRPENNETRNGRVLPTSARLAGILDLAKTDPAGQTFGPEKFVFADTVGRQVGDIERAWETCVLKAHGHTPPNMKTNAWSETSRQALEVIDLTFHDLRHERGVGCSRPAGRCTTFRTCSATRTSRRPLPTSTRPR